MPMPRRAAAKVKLKRIPLGDLVPRGGHPNRMSGRARKALKEHIAAGGLYPPLIVRPMGPGRRRFEILDGHQRAQVLGELGFADARCEVWTVSEGQAGIYAATLNYLRGRPVGVLRARQLQRLIKRFNAADVRRLLAMTPAGVRQQLLALTLPKDSSGQAGRLDLQPVVFHLPKADAKGLERRLRQLAGDESRRRGEMLMEAIGATGRANRRNNKRSKGKKLSCPS